MGALITTLLIIAAAELGDKTQLLTFSFAAKYPLWEVLAAVFSAAGLLMAVAVIFGSLITSMIPIFYIKLLAGIFFIAFGIWNWFGKEEEEEGAKQSNGSPFWIVFSAFLLAELGDKTQLATIALSAEYGRPISVWIGATLGMVLVNGIGALAGKWMGKLLPGIWLRLIGAVVFIGFGIASLIEIFIK